MGTIQREIEETIRVIQRKIENWKEEIARQKEIRDQCSILSDLMNQVELLKKKKKELSKENIRKERKLQRKLKKEMIQREIEETIRVIQRKIENWKEEVARQKETRDQCSIL